MDASEKNYPVKVILTDDHQMFIEGLSELLFKIEGVELVATANNGKEALDLLETHACDLVIIDIHMPVLDGIETTKLIKLNYPQTRVLILSMDNEINLIKSILQAGASGYILKNTGREELRKAIMKISGGGNYFSEEVSLELAHQFMPHTTADKSIHKDTIPLTEREMEILKLVALEYSNPQIADKLFISTKTVETHRKNLIKKLGVKNSLGLVKHAILKGLIAIHN